MTPLSAAVLAAPAISGTFSKIFAGFFTDFCHKRHPPGPSAREGPCRPAQLLSEDPAATMHELSGNTRG